MSTPLLQSLYSRLPAVGRDLACTLEGWRLRRLRCGGGFRRHLARFLQNQNWSEDEREAYQLEALKRMLRHCQATVPFYPRWFQEAGFDPQELRDLSDLRALPVLSKSRVLADPEQFQSTAADDRRDAVRLQTSGTTGSPLTITVTRDSLQAYQAAVARHRSWYGVHEGMLHATFNGRSIVPLQRQARPFWVQNHFGRQTLFSLYHMRDSVLDDYFQELARTPRDYIDGYPSSVSVMAAFMNERGLRLPWKPRAVFLSSETLGEVQRRAIEQAFEAPTAEFYGMAEQAACASQCPAGRFHFDTEIGYVELIPCAENPQLGRIVCTSLTNRAMPLVRYDTQDLAYLDHSCGDGSEDPTVGSRAPCPCGRRGLAVDRIDGRIESFVVTPAGARVGRLDHVYKGLQGIRESQIIQTRPDEIVVKVVATPAYGPSDEARLRLALTRRLGTQMRIRIDRVSEIPRSQSGKFRAVVSELADTGTTGATTPISPMTPITPMSPTPTAAPIAPTAP